MIIRFFSTIMLIWMLGFAWFAITLPTPMEGGKTDAIVVVTGGPDRIDRALDVLEQKWAPRLLISGVDPEVKPKELASQYKRPVKFFTCCIDLGFAASDTRGNGAETAKWIDDNGYKSIRLVTTDWHMRRARYEIEQALPPDVIVHADAVPGDPTLGMLFLEYHKYLLARVAAYVNI